MKKLLFTTALCTSLSAMPIAVHAGGFTDYLNTGTWHEELDGDGSYDLNRDGVPDHQDLDDGDPDVGGSVGGGDRSDGGDGGGDKIVCTAMNAAYGFGSFRQAIWLRHSRDHLTEYHQTGYHLLFLPLVRVAYGQDHRFARGLRKSLEHIMRERTADIRAEMQKGKRRPLGRFYRATLEPLCYITGRLAGGGPVAGVEDVPVIARRLNTQTQPTRRRTPGRLKAGLAALLVFATPAVAQDAPQDDLVYKRGQIFQNVMAEHVRPLLANTARVSRWSDDMARDKGGYVRIIWYGADGREYGCLTDYEGVTGRGSDVGIYDGYQKDFKGLSVRYPLKQASFDNGKTWYQLLRYNGENGELTTYIAKSRRWWKADVGHLQARIPAVTWELCPDFPSAESLGAKVNTRQTSRYYDQLLKQDAGQRILRPQYVTDPAHEWYGRNAERNQ